MAIRCAAKLDYLYYEEVLSVIVACSKWDYVRGSAEVGFALLPAGQGYGQTEPMLVVSNAPEKLGIPPSDPDARVLYYCEIPIPANSSKTIRVFLWHLIDGAGSGTISLRLSSDLPLTSSSIRKRQWATRVGESVDTSGKELACQQYFGTYDNVSSDSIPIENLVEAVPLTLNVAEGQLAAAVIELTIKTTLSYNLRLRTVFLGDGATAPNIDTPPVNPANPPPKAEVHVRGWWPYSLVTFSVGATLDVNPDLAPTCIFCPVEEPTLDPLIPPPELAINAFGKQLADQYGTPDGNKGLYGATVRYRFPLINSNVLFPGAAGINIVGRNIAPNFTYGSGVVAGYVGNYGKIPSISAVIPEVIVPNGGVSIAPGGAGELYFSLTIGGGAGLPCNLKVCSVPLT